MKDAASKLLSNASTRVSEFGSQGITNPTGYARSVWDKYFSCCSFAYYHKFFDVETVDVICRFKAVFLFWSNINNTPTKFSKLGEDENLNEENPVSQVSFYRLMRNSQPDLYGPIWIVTTLVLLNAICSNLGKYLASFNFVDNDSQVQEKVLTDPTVLSFSAYTIYSFSVLIPLVAYLYLHFYLESHEADKNNQNHEDFDAFSDEKNNEIQKMEERKAALKNLRTLGIFELLCIFGYSFLPFIPAVVIASIPVAQIEFFSIVLATIWSMCFLFFTLKQVCRYADMNSMFENKPVLERKLNSLEGDLDDHDDFDDLNKYASMGELYGGTEVADKRTVPMLLLLPFVLLHLIFAITLKVKFFSNSLS